MSRRSLEPSGADRKANERFRCDTGARRDGTVREEVGYDGL